MSVTTVPGSVLALPFPATVLAELAGAADMPSRAEHVEVKIPTCGLIGLCAVAGAAGVVIGFWVSLLGLLAGIGWCL